MKPYLLQVSTRLMCPALFVLSLIILYRGHNLPGGGFIGGLMAASSIIMLALAFGWASALKRVPMDPLIIMTIGMAVALISGLPGYISGDPFMAGRWLPAIEAPVIGKIKLGTPLLFDVGVYLTVLGFTVKCALAMGTHLEGETWT